MRVFFVLRAAALGLFVAACSDGSGDTTLRRGTPSAPTRAQAPTTTSGGATGSSTSTPSSPPPSNSTPAPDAGTTPPPTTPATPPAPGTCGNPKCFGLAGLGGCKATDAAGALVTMGCQDGACACLVGNQTTSTFDGDVASADDAKQLFFANCDCN